MPYIRIEIEGFLPSPDCVLHLVERSTIKPSQCAKDEDVLLHPQPPMKTRPRVHGNQTNTALAMVKMVEGVYVTTLALGKEREPQTAVRALQNDGKDVQFARYVSERILQ